MSDRLLSYLRETLATADDEVVTFQWMSDEETAAIETDDESELTVQPWIEVQDDIDPRICRRFGERSLFLRGLLEAAVDEETGQPTLAITDDLRLVADARRLGDAYILARSLHNGVRTARNNVLQSQSGVFEEEIDADGIHLFSACTYRAALNRLAAWALPFADHGGVEMRTRISADRWQQWVVNELGVDVRVVEVNLFLPGPSGSLEPEHWLMAHANDVAVLAIPDGDSLQVASMTTSRLGERLRSRVATALDVLV